MSNDTIDFEIRRAGPNDAATLSRISAETFAATFGDIYYPRDLEAYLNSAYTLEKSRGELSDPETAVWLAERGGVAIGYIHVGRCDLPHPEVTPDCGELKRVYLTPAAQGGGIGSRLMDEGLAWLLRGGPRHIWLGVWSGNRAAQRLYARQGFEKVGEYYFKVGEALDREFIMRRD